MIGIYDGCLGGKTGYTDTALNTLVTYFEKDGTVYICVVLHYKGTEVFTDTVMLAEYTKEFEKLQVSPKNIHSQAEPQLCQKNNNGCA